MPESEGAPRYSAVPTTVFLRFSPDDEVFVGFLYQINSALVSSPISRSTRTTRGSKREMTRIWTQKNVITRIISGVAGRFDRLLMRSYQAGTD
jgi:hypothetical protein